MRVESGTSRMRKLWSLLSSYSSQIVKLIPPNSTGRVGEACLTARLQHGRHSPADQKPGLDPWWQHAHRKEEDGDDEDISSDNNDDTSLHDQYCLSLCPSYSHQRHHDPRLSRRLHSDQLAADGHHSLHGRSLPTTGKQPSSASGRLQGRIGPFPRSKCY